MKFTKGILTLPPKKDRKNFAWSYSRWSAYSECPAKYIMGVYRKLWGLPDYVSSPNAERGERIHKLAENYVRGKIKGCPTELVQFEEELDCLVDLKAYPEEDWCFDKDWNEVRSDDWNNIWLRAKTDAHVLTSGTDMTIVDYKTGRIYDSHASQAELYAVAGYKRYEGIESVDVEFWYIDQEDVIPYTYNKNHLEQLYKKWVKRATSMEKATKFPAKPGRNACRFCDFKAKNGGPCELAE